jgi:hypothetical protein
MVRGHFQEDKLLNLKEFLITDNPGAESSKMEKIKHLLIWRKKL